MAATTLHDRIQWHEGMLLSPQHLQQESARVDALVGWQALAAQPWAWGIRKLVVDEARLTVGVVRISLLEAILPNGMAVTYDAASAQGLALELDLEACALGVDDMPVWLVLGTSRSLRLPGQPSMFRPIESSLVEDEVSEALAEEVPRMAARVALQAGAPPGPAWIALQLMTVRKENEIVTRGAFWPAQLEVDAAAPLAARARTLAALMRSKAMFLAQQSSANMMRLEDRVAMIEQRMQLAHLALHLPLLEAALDAPVVQPHALYLALCAQLGALAALRPGAVPLTPPRYVHGDSYAAFEAVLDNLLALASEVSVEWRSRAFTLAEEMFSLAMPAEWVTPRLVIGVRGDSPGELARWMDGATIGSRTVSASLRSRRMPGAARKAIDAAPELALRAGAGLLLFEVAADPLFIVAGQDLVIGNDNGQGAGQRPRDIVLFIKG